MAQCRSIQLKNNSVTHRRNDIPTMEFQTMSLQCPRCNSPKIASLHQAMKISAAIGTLDGAARGSSAALAGSQTGALIGAMAGPVGITLGSVSIAQAFDELYYFKRLGDLHHYALHRSRVAHCQR